MAEAEWLEADGLGGFASGTVSGIRTRRYHALLLQAKNPPTGRVVLVNGIEAWVETPAGTYAISSQRYQPDVVHPDGQTPLAGFTTEPWPTWRFQADCVAVSQEIICKHGESETLLRWQMVEGAGPARLCVRPLVCGRDYHALHRENPSFRFDARIGSGKVSWQPYEGLSRIDVAHNGSYQHSPDWYRNFIYSEERSRGLDCIEDLASPGVFSWDLERGEAVLVLRAVDSTLPPDEGLDVGRYAGEVFRAERRRRHAFGSPLERAADTYIVQRGSGKTIVAGYPWFTDWGRDTFIALRGLCIARGELDLARDILVEWAGAVSEGMLPNRFPDAGEEPEYNSVDASLWYIVAVYDYFVALESRGLSVSLGLRKRLRDACDAIVEGYARGTRFGIRMDTDGLLAAGVPGVQLTWMDAKVGDWVVTPRIGKPVEVQALWLNALQIVSDWSPRWSDDLAKGTAAFRSRFWREDARCLFDVVDVDHVAGRQDPAFRPNQIFAVGGLPFAVVDDSQARAIVDAVEGRLLTPFGLRSLAPGEPGYRPHYRGGVLERDSAYHQGTVWPWLIGPFVEAWLRIHGATADAKIEARRRYVRPLMDHLESAGLGHGSEVVDAEPPHQPGGCPFQAWSLGELIRVRAMLDAPATKSRRVTAARPPASKSAVRRSR